MPESPSGSIVQPVLLTLLAAAFAAWAGVVLWAANTISERLTGVEGQVREFAQEIAEFKLDLSQRITKAEVQAERVQQLEQTVHRIDVNGPATPNQMLEERVRKLERK